MLLVLMVLLMLRRLLLTNLVCFCCVSSRQVAEAKLLIRELFREEALARVEKAMENEDYDVLIKAIQVCGLSRLIKAITCWCCCYCCCCRSRGSGPDAL